MSDTIPSLFPSDDLPAEPTGGPYARVAIERSLDRVLDYRIPPQLQGQVQVGQRVRVPLGRGNKPAHGYVTAISPTTSAAASVKIKPVLAIADTRLLLSPSLMELARWMGRYYCCPLGTVIESIIPSAVKRKVGLGYTSMVRLGKPREELQKLLETTRAAKRRAILARLLQLKDEQSIDLIQLAGEAGATIATVRKLTKIGLILITVEPDYMGVAPPALLREHQAEAGQILNEDQQKVFDELLPRATGGGFSVNLLHGVTGSGKTEVYLRIIQEVVARGKRAIILVPEIALTPQTMARFMARFPRVAMLHSGLAATARHQFWQAIAQGQADVVVGARSAVFAPLPDLGIIVIDEEHEPSYKQDTAPRYNGRDVAIKRGQIENVPVLLGSATPSLESFYRASQTVAPSHYHLLSLPHRVRGLQLPVVELVDMKREKRIGRPGIHLLSQRLEALLRSTIDAGRQAILLLNRRGYSSYVYCPSCGRLMQCKYCDVTMTYHRSAEAHAHGGSLAEGVHTGQLHCHYCLAVNPLPDKCPDCSKKLSLFGLGTQRVEEELARKFPDLKFARVDSDTMRNVRDYEAVLGKFARREIQVMVGTQMIAKGLDYPNVTLVGVINGDTALSLPDFRAAERTFQLITQVAGRAGRGEHPGRVVLQTFMPDDRTIQAAISQDFLGFARGELLSRQQVGLPPMARMVRIIVRDADATRLQERAEKLAIAITACVHQQPDAAGISIRGPMPCAINRISGYHRFQILLFSKTPASLQRVLAKVRHDGAFTEASRVAVDVDPVSLL